MQKARIGLLGGIAAGLLWANARCGAADEAGVTRGQLLLLQQQNQKLLEQVQNQQQMIEALSRKVADIQDFNAKHTPETTTPTATGKSELPASSDTDTGLRIGKVDITGEGGVAFFNSQANGQNPHSTFRIDEAKVFLEAPVWEDVYFFTELDLASRESTSLDLNVGELYLDFEDVSKLWGRDHQLNVRAGRFYSPFGEEYMNRFAIDNPLISHSVSDLWGADDGVEFYGKAGQVQYAVAVQNGGSTSQALQDDKAVSGRIGYDPVKWLHLSASGMRTADLNVHNGVSAMWFGNGFFRSLGSSNTTHFHANMVEGDVQLRSAHQQIKAAGGYINYGDNDPLTDNHHDVYYYYLEGTEWWTRKFYSAARFSQVFAANGFPIVGNGPMGDYLFGDLTSEYWRLSLGLGYRFSPNLLIKCEYSLNEGTIADGSERRRENEVSVEAAFKF